MYQNPELDNLMVAVLPFTDIPDGRLEVFHEGELDEQLDKTIGAIAVIPIIGVENSKIFLIKFIFLSYKCPVIT